MTAPDVLDDPAVRELTFGRATDCQDVAGDRRYLAFCLRNGRSWRTFADGHPSASRQPQEDYADAARRTAQAIRDAEAFARKRLEPITSRTRSFRHRTAAR